MKADRYLDKPHGLDYSLTMHAPSGECLVGFDNAHRPSGQRGGVKDHRHRMRQVKAYDYTNGGALVTAFWAEVTSMLERQGDIP